MGVPLLLQLIFVVVLFYLLNQAETLTMRVERARQIRAAAGRLQNGFGAASISLLEYGYGKMPGSKNRFLGFMDLGARSQRQLRDLIGDDPERREAFEALDARATDVYKRMMWVYNRIESTGSVQIDPINLLSIHTARAAIMNQLLDLGMKVTTLTNIGEPDLEPQEEERARRRLKEFLIGGISLNFLVAASLVLGLGAPIIRRINVIRDNTLRLAAGRDLHPVLRGSDEIARLDKVFHNMADTLQEAQRKERAIVDFAADVICSLDEAGRFISVNPAVEESWGYEPSALIGARFTEFLASEDVQRVSEAIEGIRSRRTSGSFECKIIHKNRSEVHTVWSLRWSEVDKALFCVLHDITERKELEQLRQHFIAMVSHELRTPLNTVKNFCAMLAEPIYGLLNDRGEIRRASVEREVDRLQRLIDDLLDLEKLESGKFELYLKDTSLAEVMRRSSEAVLGLAEKKKVKVEFPSEDLNFMADEDRIIQVLVNLISNAIKFSPAEGTVKVTARVDGAEIELSVEDAGVGLPPGAEKTLFTRFKQFSQGKEARQGTGLGLAICKEIVTAHFGTIGFQSTKDKGSTFWFRLPLESKAS